VPEAVKEQGRSSLLGCDTVLLDEWFLMFQRNTVFSPSGFRQSKNSQHGNSLGCLTFENEGNAFLQNSRNHLPNDTGSRL